MSPRKIFLDTETTGLNPRFCRIVEIAAIEVDENDQPVASFHEYLNPKQDVGDTFRIHGLSNAFLADKKTFAEVAQSFIDFIKGAEIFAHNMLFDKSFLDAELSRAGFKPLITYGTLTDTLKIAKSKLTCSCSLDNLLDIFNIDRSARRAHHGALIDAELLLLVYLALIGKKDKISKVSFDAMNEEDRAYQRASYAGAEPEFEDEGESEDDELDDYERKLNAIIDFGYENDFFCNVEMYESILEQLEENRFLTERQKNAIDNVYFGLVL